MRLFSKTVLHYLMFFRTRNVFVVLPRKEDGFAPGSHTDELAKASASMSKKEEVPAEVGKRSSAIHSSLPYLTYPYVIHVNSELRNDALNKELTKRGKVVLVRPSNLETFKGV